MRAVRGRPEINHLGGRGETSHLRKRTSSLLLCSVNETPQSVLDRPHSGSSRTVWDEPIFSPDVVFSVPFEEVPSFDLYVTGRESTPFCIQLRPYQTEAIARLQHRVDAGARRVLVVSVMGSGKTILAGSIIASAVQEGQRILFLAHRREFINQARRKLLDFGLTPDSVGVVMASDARRRPGAPVQVASVDTLRHRARPAADLVFVDECFPAGTLVDERPIESIREGDFVSAFNHQTGEVERKRVLRCFVSTPSALVTIHFASGARLTCTPSHPVFCDRGYIPAAQLQPGDVAYRRTDAHQTEDMRCVRDPVRPEVVERQDGSDLFCQVSRQVGSRRPRADAWHRSGWPQPLCARAAGAGREEGCLPCESRVDRVEVHQRCGNGFGELCPDGRVYNLEVEGHNNYFANGFLVHNCHRALARTYRAIAADFPRAIPYSV